MEENQEPVGAAVQDAVELTAIVAAKLAQLALDLGAVGEREMRDFVAEHVEAVDLVVDGGLYRLIKGLDELSDRLATMGVAVVDGSEVAPAAAGEVAERRDRTGGLRCAGWRLPAIDEVFAPISLSNLHGELGDIPPVEYERDALTAAAAGGLDDLAGGTSHGSPYGLAVLDPAAPTDTLITVQSK